MSTPTIPGADHYRGKHNGRDGYPLVGFNARGYTTIQPLPFLHGKPWDDIALGYIHALRPSRVRVSTGSVQLDAQSWRVTVWLQADGETISRITQEVEVGLPDGIEDGHALEIAATPLPFYKPPRATFAMSAGYKEAMEATFAAHPEMIKELFQRLSGKSPPTIDQPKPDAQP